MLNGLYFLKVRSKVRQFLVFTAILVARIFCIGQLNLKLLKSHFFLSSCLGTTVTMQAQKEAPPDMQCKDKFLIQSVVAENGATPQDITPEVVVNFAALATSSVSLS